jgi:hypothetical protein
MISSFGRVFHKSAKGPRRAADTVTCPTNAIAQSSPGQRPVVVNKPTCVSN